MGLSIHCRLSLSPEKDVPGLANLPAHWAVEDTRTLALKMKRRGAFDAVGPLKDADGDGGGVPARIFEHPQFERLEAEGETLLRAGKTSA